MDKDILWFFICWVIGTIICFYFISIKIPFPYIYISQILFYFIGFMGIEEFKLEKK